MAKQIQVEMIATEFIKPHSQIPDDQKIYKLSYLDQLAYSMYLPAVFFYQKNNTSIVETSMILKASLSKTLTLFYPFAGRLIAENFLDCNDEGVEFKEARIDCDLIDVLRQPSAPELKKLLPVDPESKLSPSSSLLQLQVNYFKCGAIAIGFCATHKLGDAINIYTFMKSWADNTIGSKSNEELINPSFIASSIFPPRDSTIPRPYDFGDTSKLLLQRFIFDASKIAELKSQVSSAAVPRPSRVEAITALTWKCNITTSRFLSASSSAATKFLCTHAVNLRRRFSPPLPDYAFGNLAGMMLARTDNEVTDMREMVTLLRKKSKEFGVDKSENSFGTNEEIGELMGGGGKVEIVNCSSLCGLPFYQVDFGWGNPMWVALTNVKYPDFAILSDTKEGDGVELWLCMTREKMTLFEQNQEFLAFANVNPNIL